MSVNDEIEEPSCHHWRHEEDCPSCNWSLAEDRTVEKIVAWLRAEYVRKSSMGPCEVGIYLEAADAIEKEWHGA